MSWQIRYLTRASKQLTSIAEFIANESQSYETASNELERLLTATESLREFPHRGSLPRNPTLRGSDHRVLMAAPYLIFYRCDEVKQVVTITAVIHAKQDYRFLI